MSETVSLNFTLLCRLHREEADDLWVAGCPRLDVFSQGSTRDGAKSALKEAVELFIESCVERGTLDGVLRDCGFRVTPPGRQIPAGVEHVHVERVGIGADADDSDDLLGEAFPLDVTIPAYQAALLLEGSNELNAR